MADESTTAVSTQMATALSHTIRPASSPAQKRASRRTAYSKSVLRSSCRPTGPQSITIGKTKRGWATKSIAVRATAETVNVPAQGTCAVDNGAADETGGARDEGFDHGMKCMTDSLSIAGKPVPTDKTMGLAWARVCWTRGSRRAKRGRGQRRGWRCLRGDGGRWWFG